MFFHQEVRATDLNFNSALAILTISVTSQFVAFRKSSQIFHSFAPKGIKINHRAGTKLGARIIKHSRTDDICSNGNNCYKTMVNMDFRPVIYYLASKLGPGEMNISNSCSSDQTK